MAEPTPPPASEWTAFARRYMAADGRVIDTANNGVSHSEGQGYAMFFAAFFKDKPRFDRLWGWTDRNLGRREDALFAWRFDPRARVAPVADFNNATDGDIFIAWALLMAHEAWGNPAHFSAAQRITRDLLGSCVVQVGQRTVLLPGAAGFQDAAGTVINLSYYSFPALRALSHLVPDRRWALLERDGIALIQAARFGRWHLPPDWLLVQNNSGPPIPAPQRPARFSWDALRIPLNLAWNHLDVSRFAAERLFWDDVVHAHRPPAWVDLRTGETPPYRGHAGVQAVHALLRQRSGASVGEYLRVAQAPDYFGASLVLQSRIAGHMPAVEPAPSPTTAAAAPQEAGFATWIASMASDAIENTLEWLGLGQPEPEPPDPTGVPWARPDIGNAAYVRGMQPGPRGLPVRR